jgi:hypothetical protein
MRESYHKMVGEVKEKQVPLDIAQGRSGVKEEVHSGLSHVLLFEARASRPGEG